MVHRLLVILWIFPRSKVSDKVIKSSQYTAYLTLLSAFLFCFIYHTVQNIMKLSHSTLSGKHNFFVHFSGYSFGLLYFYNENQKNLLNKLIFWKNEKNILINTFSHFFSSCNFWEISILYYLINGYEHQ